MGACCSSSNKQHSKARRCPRVSVTTGKSAVRYVIHEIAAEQVPVNKPVNQLQPTMDYLSVERYNRDTKSFELPRFSANALTSGRTAVSQRQSMSSRLGLKPTRQNTSAVAGNQAPRLRLRELQGEHKTYRVLKGQRDTLLCRYSQARDQENARYSVASYETARLQNFPLTGAGNVHALVQAEAATLKATAHSHVLAVVELIGSPTASQVHLVSELVLPIKAPLSPEKARHYFSQLVQAVDFLHTEKALVHRGLSQESVLQTCEGTVKLAHFHLSRPSFLLSLNTYPIV